MNITLQFQELDDLNLKHTSPPTTSILRNKLHTMRDQLEAHFAAKEKLQLGELVKNDGVFWKRTATGFESRLYCPECPSHPVMMDFPPGSKQEWACPANHSFAYDSKPPMT